MRDATQVVHAGLPEQSQGLPFLPGPVFAAPFHLAGDPASSPYTYGRYHINAKGLQRLPVQADTAESVTLPPRNLNQGGPSEIGPLDRSSPVVPGLAHP
jgi:hypothetical protein